MIPSSPPVSRQSCENIGSPEAGRFTSSSVSNSTRIGVATPSPQTMHSRLRSAGMRNHRNKRLQLFDDIRHIENFF